MFKQFTTAVGNIIKNKYLLNPEILSTNVVKKVSS